MLATAFPKSLSTSVPLSHQSLFSLYGPDNIFTSTICSIGPSLFNDPFTFLIFIGLSNFFNLNPCFYANSKLITSPVALLSNNASTIISFYISILSNPIFTVISLKGFVSTFFTSFLIPSDSEVPAFISIASILNLL